MEKKKNLTVRDIMTERVITVDVKTSVGEVARLLLRHRISGVIVIDGEHTNKIAGIFTTTDLLSIVDHIMIQKGSKRFSLFENISEKPIKKYITKNVFSLSKTDNLLEAILLMQRKKAHTIPVIDDGKLVGVLGKHDILDVAFTKGLHGFEKKEPPKEVKTILVIEDNEIDMRFIQKTLKLAGYKVLKATTGEQGIKLATLNKVELILLDIFLPDIDGNEVLRKLKAGSRTKAIPVISITISNAPKDIIKQFQLHTEFYIIKPFDAKYLIKYVNGILE